MFPSEEAAQKWAKQNNIKTGFLRAHKIHETEEGNWVVENLKGGYEYSYNPEMSNREDGVAQSSVIYANKPNYIESEAKYLYNSLLGRAIISDFVQVSFCFDGIVGVGSGSSIDVSWQLRGKEASLFPMISVTESVGAGFSVGATVNFQRYNYFGPVSNIKRNMIQTTPNIGNLTYGVSGGTSFLGEANINGTYTYLGGYPMISMGCSIGVGIPLGVVPVNGCVTTSYTQVLYDFKN